MSESTDTEVDELYEALQRLVGKSSGRRSFARDPVNLPMIRHLTDALGDRNPVYVDEELAAQSVHKGLVAPATALQMWTMRGLLPPGVAGAEAMGSDAENPNRLCDAAGYVGVVATNCDQTYLRYLRPGDHLSLESSIESISPRKKTALGEGYFITTLETYRDQSDEVVGQMRFRILKFKPAAREEPKQAEEPAIPPPRESAFFWEGLEQGELRIERCVSCGTLRHPPRPMCPNCQSLERDHVVASGRGTVYSYVVHHHPPLPDMEMPVTIGLIELEEGTRVVGNVVDIDPDDVTVGLPVEVVFQTGRYGHTVPNWRPC